MKAVHPVHRRARRGGRGTRVQPGHRRFPWGAPHHRPFDEWAQGQLAAENVTADLARVVLGTRAGTHGGGAEDPIPKVGGEAFDLGDDGLGHVDLRVARQVRVRPEHLTPHRCPRWVENAGPDGQHDRMPGHPAVGDGIRRRDNFVAAATEVHGGACRTLGLAHGTGPESAKSIVNTPVPYRYQSSARRYRSGRASPAKSARNVAEVLSSVTRNTPIERMRIRNVGGDEAHSARQLEGTEERESQRRRVDRRTQVVPITGKGDLGGAQTATGRTRPLHDLHREAGTREKNRGREAVGPRPDHIDIDHGAPCPISFTSPTAYTGTTHQPVRLTRDRSLS